MSGFEVLFSFYGLLLGIGVANATSGFANLWRRRVEWRMGVAPPLLGLFILLAVAQQWMSFWGARDDLTMGPWELLVAMAMALPYIFVSQAMFPIETDESGSLEQYYIRHSRILMATLLIPPLVSLAYNLYLMPDGMSFTDIILWAAAGYGARTIIPIALMIWNHKWLHRIGIALLCVLMLFAIFA